MSDSTQSREVLFEWRHRSSDGGDPPLTCALAIPTNANLDELAFRLIKEHGLPFYAKAELVHCLEIFIRGETSRYFNENAENVLRSHLVGNETELVTTIAKKYRQEHKKFANIGDEKNDTEDDEFALLYHTLMHSGCQPKIRAVEDGFSAKARAIRAEMEADFESLIEKQNRELENGESSELEHLLNQVASVHVEERLAFEKNWHQRLCLLRNTQREEMLKFMRNASIGKFIKPHPDTSLDCEEAEEASPVVALSESFTIHLGSQLKVMHNLRLTCSDLLDLCRRRSPEEALQTSMSLFSSNLIGGVLLVDNRVSSYKGTKREFAEICKSRGELHFPDIETQLLDIRTQYWKAVASSERDSSTPRGPRSPSDDDVRLRAGDVYITRHSNLGRAHVVFHLVAGSDEEDLATKELNSRHQVIQGLRNILRIAYERDIRTLSIPLLLTNSLTPQMSAAWCSKRAELIYKCAKGFMIEMASLVADAGDPRTVEFVVPPGISESTFYSLSSMLQSIFKMANPLVLKTTT